MNKMMTVTSFYGESFDVDTSDEACGKFKDENGRDFKHGDLIRHPDAGLGSVMGVTLVKKGMNPKLLCVFDEFGAEIFIPYPFAR